MLLQMSSQAVDVVVVVVVVVVVAVVGVVAVVVDADSSNTGVIDAVGCNELVATSWLTLLASFRAQFGF